MYETYRNLSDLFECDLYYDWEDEMEYDSLYIFPDVESEYTVMCHTRAAASAIKEKYPECYYPAILALTASTAPKIP